MTPEQFWSRTVAVGDCLEWSGGRGADGYGAVYRKTGSRRAHRVAWELTNGPIPDGMQINHHCDNPPCVKPEHLYVGTAADNVRDMTERGRMSHVRRRINVTAARDAINRTGSFTAAAQELGCTRQALHGIVRRGRLTVQRVLVIDGVRHVSPVKDAA